MVDDTYDPDYLQELDRATLIRVNANLLARCEKLEKGGRSLWEQLPPQRLDCDEIVSLKSKIAELEGALGCAWANERHKDELLRWLARDRPPCCPTEERISLSEEWCKYVDRARRERESGQIMLGASRGAFIGA